MTMRVVMMHKSSQDNEAGVLPSPELMAGMGKLMQEMGKAGRLIAGEGLQASSKGVRLNFSEGKRFLTYGPFTGLNELVAGFAIVRVKSLEEAIDWATRFAKVVGDVEIDVRPVMEPWDLGMFPKPEGDLTKRFMILIKADEKSEAGVLPTPELAAQMRKLTEDMTKAGVLLLAEGLQPSSKSVRLNFSDGKRTLTDGPFTESKELIAGFAMVRVSSLEEAIDGAHRFAAVVGNVEIDLRPLVEA
jgi:hypothetical protein